MNANDIEGAQLFFVAQLLPKRDGGLYICNWQGHDGEAAKGHYPQLIEINGAGKMVWDLNDNATFGMISLFVRSIKDISGLLIIFVHLNSK